MVDRADGGTPPPLQGTAARDAYVAGRELDIHLASRAQAGDENAAGTRLDEAAGVQLGSGNLQVNNFYGNRPARADGNLPATAWRRGVERAAPFVGRTAELARLSRWAADEEVRVIGVTSWGGMGKTSLVAQWADTGDWPSRHPGIRGAFEWTFNTDPSVENWCAALLEWADRELGPQPDGRSRAASVLSLLQRVPLLLVLDGLEVIQQELPDRETVGADRADGRYGRLLNGLLREVLVGACQLEHHSLIVLTSRFPFADLDIFDGGAARIAEVPALSASEGSALLKAAGGHWVADGDRQLLAEEVEGNALAVSVLASALAAHPQTEDLASLRGELAETVRTDSKVSLVLRFYSGRLTEQDRYLVAAVSLFAAPVPAEAVLAVSAHPAFLGLLAGWTASDIDAAVRRRVGGVVSRRPDRTLSCHVLVRDAFRPLALGAAGTAVDVTLAGLPKGRVATAEDAGSVAEAIALLVQAGEWSAADDLYRSRAGDGAVWTNLATASLGFRAASEFAAPSRRTACAASLGTARLSYYLNETGERALFSGSLKEAQEYLREAVAHSQQTRNTIALSRAPANLIACLGYLGDIDAARGLADGALRSAQTSEDRLRELVAYAQLGWLAGLAGDSAASDDYYMAADRLSLDDSRAHLHFLPGVQWAESLLRTGRPGPAAVLTDANRERSSKKRLKPHTARCDHIAGRIALAAGDTQTAGARLAAAAQSFRDGDYLLDLPAVLTDLAEYERVSGNLDSARRHVDEAEAIARPRELMGALADILSASARISVSQFIASGNRVELSSGRDRAEAAARIAASRRLPWHALNALQAHALLDQAEGTGHQSSAQADALRARLIPASLTPNPLQAPAGQD